jgi:hypothetical protein
MTSRWGKNSIGKLRNRYTVVKKLFGIPALTDGTKSITTSIEKAEVFNTYFVSQQTQPPLRFNQQLAPIQFLTENRLEYIQTTKN